MKKKPAWAKHQDEKPAKVTPAELTPYPEGREVMGCMSAVPMTDTKKRILPWKYDEQADPFASADTLIGGYVVIRTFNSRFLAFRYGGVAWIDINNGHEPFDSISAALDACEADYVARCTEFLTLYDPSTHVVVSRECAESAIEGLEETWGSEVSRFFPIDILEENRLVVVELRAAMEVGK